MGTTDSVLRSGSGRRDYPCYCIWDSLSVKRSPCLSECFAPMDFNTLILSQVYMCVNYFALPETLPQNGAYGNIEAWIKKNRRSLGLPTRTQLIPTPAHLPALLEASRPHLKQAVPPAFPRRSHHPACQPRHYGKRLKIIPAGALLRTMEILS